VALQPTPLDPRPAWGSDQHPPPPGTPAGRHLRDLPASAPSAAPVRREAARPRPGIPQACWPVRSCRLCTPPCAPTPARTSARSG